MVVLSFEEAEHYLTLAVSEARQCLLKPVREVPICCLLINEDKEIISIAHNQTNESKNGSRHCELVAIDNYILGDDFERKKNNNLIKCYNNGDHDLVGSFQKWGLHSETCFNTDDTAKEKEAAIEENIVNNEHMKALKNRIENLKKCCIVVTCEPCGMCTYAIQLIGIKNVYFCCKNDRFGGCVSFPSIWGTKNNTKLHFIKGKCTEESIALLRRFYDLGNPSAPEEKRKRPLKDVDDSV